MSNSKDIDVSEMTREQLLGEIMHLRKRVQQLEDRNTELSWEANPDHSGGQFDLWELADRGWL